MPNYFLHTGLHKTGTKFFQHKVFPNLDKKRFHYNPPLLCQLVADLMKADDADVQLVVDAIEAEKKRLNAEDGREVLISREIMSGDLFSFYQDYKSTYSRISRAFPEAKILFSMRYQLDWLVSCYRETVHEHHYQSLQQFLGLEPGECKFAKANYHALDWTKILDALFEHYDSEQLNFFFYEDFKNDKFRMVSKFSQILGVDDIAVKLDHDQIPNRGYSKFSIKLSILRYRLLKTLGLARLLVHRPIFFFGEKGIPAGFENLSVLPKDKYWHDGFLRDNEEVRSKNYPDNLTMMERFKLRFSWRRIIKEGVDKLFYKDGDLIGSHRETLDTFFKKNNQNLQEKYRHVLGELPQKYTD